MVSSKVETKTKGIESYRVSSSSKYNIPDVISVTSDDQVSRIFPDESSMDENRVDSSTVTKEFNEMDREDETMDKIETVRNISVLTSFDASEVSKGIFDMEREEEDFREMGIIQNPSIQTEANFSYTSRGTNSIDEEDQRYLTRNKSFTSRMTFSKQKVDEKSINLGTFSVDDDSCNQRYTPSISHQPTAGSMDYGDDYDTTAFMHDGKDCDMIEEEGGYIDKEENYDDDNYDHGRDIIDEVVEPAVRHKNGQGKIEYEYLTDDSTPEPDNISNVSVSRQSVNMSDVSVSINSEIANTEGRKESNAIIEKSDDLRRSMNEKMRIINVSFNTVEIVLKEGNMCFDSTPSKMDDFISEEIISEENAEETKEEQVEKPGLEVDQVVNFEDEVLNENNQKEASKKIRSEIEKEVKSSSEENISDTIKQSDPVEPLEEPAFKSVRKLKKSDVKLLKPKNKKFSFSRMFRSSKKK